jgi:uncharacterized protein (DUF885 family)
LKKSTGAQVRYLIRWLCMLFVWGCNVVQRVPPTPIASRIPDVAPAMTQARVPGEIANSQLLLGEKVQSLKRLQFDQFLERSYELILLRDPEGLTGLGLAKRFGVRNDHLTDISDVAIRENYTLDQEIYDTLQSYPRQTLSAEQQISYDTYAWYLDDLIRQKEFMYNDYPINPLVVTGVQYQIIHLFADLQPLSDEQEARDYLARLGQVDEKIIQLIEGLKLREKVGVIPPRLIIQSSLGDIQGIASSPAGSTPFYTSYKEKINGLTGIQDEIKQELLDSAIKEINRSVLPGFKKLADYLKTLEGKAPVEVGVWQYLNGEAYYNFTLRRHTTTAMTADEIHALGLRELERIHGEMRVIFDQLGYPKEGNLSELYNRVARDSGFDSGGQILADYKALIEGANRKLDQAFNLKTRAEIVVVGVPQGGYYEGPALDGTRPGTFYATLQGNEAKFGMPSLAYHEGIPGHHLQIALASEQDLPLFRNVVLFNAYSEGWALYAERLAWELGWYKDKPYGDLGRLQYEAFRSARLVVDTGIHAKKWTFDRAVDFMVENTGMQRSYLEYEVTRYISWPGQATSYMVGMLKILELRQKAIDQLGDKFDLKEFHNVVLGNGSMPLDVLEGVVDEYITAKKSQ